MPSNASFATTLRAHASKASRSRSTRAAANRSRSPKPAPESAKRRPAPTAPEHTSQASECAPLPHDLDKLPNRGRLLCPKSVALIIFPDATKRQLPGKAKWVRKNVPYKLPLGYKTPRWFEADVLWWFEELRRESHGKEEEGDG